MNYTEKYHLPQWDETDRVLRTDFNEAMSSLEEGIAAAQTAANTAQASAGNAQTAADNAQTAADNAQTSANAAMVKASAAFSPDQMPYVVGSYVGTGAPQDIVFGFRPSFIIISGQKTEAENPAVLFVTGNDNSGPIHFYADFIEIYPTTGYYPQIDIIGRTYHYIAFR